VLDDDFVVSIATEFIENPGENQTKQDCEKKAFSRVFKNDVSKTADMLVG
jgi:hypothetical protein